MPFTFGRNLKFGLNIESAYNTYVAPAASDGIAILEGGFTPARVWMEVMTAQSLPEKKITDLVAGPTNYVAHIRCKLPKEGFGQLLKNVYGTVADTAVSAPFGGTRHTFSASNTTPTSISLLISDDIQAYQLSGAAVKTLRLVGEIGQPVVAEIDFVGGSWVQAASGVGSMTVPTTASTINPYWHTNAITTINAVGTAWTPSRWELVVECAYADGLAESYEISTTTAASNARKQLERAGDFPITYILTAERLLQATTQFIAFTAGTQGATSVELKETGSTTDTSTGTNDYYAKINMATSVIKEYTQDKATDIIKETLVIEGYQNVSTDNNFILKDKNSVG